MFVNGLDQETAGALYFDTQLSIFITESVFYVNYKFFNILNMYCRKIKYIQIRIHLSMEAVLAFYR